MRATHTFDAPTGASVRPYEGVEAPTRTISEAVEGLGYLRNRTGIRADDSLDLSCSAAQLHSEALEKHLRSLANRRAREELPALLEELSELGFSWPDIARTSRLSVSALRKWRLGAPRNRREPQEGGHDGRVLRHRAGGVSDQRGRELAGDTDPSRRAPHPHGHDRERSVGPSFCGWPAPTGRTPNSCWTSLSPTGVIATTPRSRCSRGPTAFPASVSSSGRIEGAAWPRRNSSAGMPSRICTWRRRRMRWRYLVPYSPGTF